MHPDVRAYVVPAHDPLRMPSTIRVRLFASYPLHLEVFHVPASAVHPPAFSPPASALLVAGAEAAVLV